MRLLLRHHIIRKLLVINTQCLVPDLDNPCPNLTLTIQILECIKILHFILEQVVIRNLLLRLFPVKLILENPNLVIKSYQLIIKCPTLFWLFVINPRIRETLIALSRYDVLLGLQLSGSCLSVKVSCHKVLVSL